MLIYVSFLTPLLLLLFNYLYPNILTTLHLTNIDKNIPQIILPSSSFDLNNLKGLFHYFSFVFFLFLLLFVFFLLLFF